MRHLPTLSGAVVCALQLLSPLPLGAQQGDAVAEIRSVRAASNAALAAGDLDAFMASIDGDYVGTAGSGGHIRSRAELRERIGGIFTGTPGLHFVRTPEEIRVSVVGDRAVESGRWVEMLPGSSGARAGRGGAYTAHWRRAAGTWVIHAEVFVSL